MAESQALIQVWARQNRLVEALDQFQGSLERLLRQLQHHPSFRLSKTNDQFYRIHKNLHDRLEDFNDFFQNVTLSQWEIKPQLEKAAEKAREIQKSLREAPRSLSREQWEFFLSLQGQKISELKDQLKNINLKGVKTLEGNSHFVDHADTLGIHQVIQWPRKIFHIASALFIAWVYEFSRGSYDTKLTILGVVTAYEILCDGLRLVFPKINAMAVRSLKPYMRKKEVDRLSSMSFYLLSIFLVCWWFPKGVAILAILYLGIGDPLASIIGIKCGRHQISQRFSLEGSLTFFATCFLITLLYPQIVPSYQGNIWAFAALGGLIGMTSEWISDRIDDNFVIPLYSAFFLWLFVGRV